MASITESVGCADDMTTVRHAGRSASAVADTVRVAVSWPTSAPTGTAPRVRARASAGVVMVADCVGGLAIGVAVLTGEPPRVSRWPALLTEAVKPLRATTWPEIRCWK